MKVLMISNQYPPDFLGGDAVFCRTLSEGLVDEGWDVDVLSNPYAFSYVTGKDVEKEGSYSLNGVRVVPAEYGFFKLLRNQLGYLTSNKDEIRKIRKIDPDIIHLHNFSSFGLKFLKKLDDNFDVPLVMTVHDNWLICPFRKREVKDCKKGCFGCSYNKYKIPISFPREYVKYIDRMIFPSKFYRDMFLDHFGEELPRSEVICNFTYDWRDKFDFGERIRERLGVPEGKKVVLYVGHLRREKGVDKLLDAAERLEDCFFILVGEDRDDLMEGRDLENVRHLGLLPSFSKKLYSLYRIADLFVLPTLWENCPLTVLEAMSFGLPVLASDVGGVPELVSENGRLFPLEDVSRLDEVVEEFLKEDLETMGKESRRLFEKEFNVEKGLERYIEVYGSV